MLLIGAPNPGFFLASSAYCGAVALLALGIIAVNLHQHGVIDFGTKAIRNRCQVHLESVRGQLDPVSETPCEILNELRGAAGITLADQPRTDQFGVGVNRYPGPGAADTKLIFPRGWNVLVLRANEAPYFVALNPLAVEVHQVLVEVVRTSRAKLNQQFRDGVFGNASHANRGANRAAFNEGRYNRRALGFI